jgi:hypothetical protein
MSTIPVIITVGDQRLVAAFADSATSDALLVQLPLTLEMLDLYGHELVHRFEEPLPTSSLVTATPQRGDIVYWSPRNALAIFYGDGDQPFSDLQMLGRIESGLDHIDQPGDITATFTHAEG